MCMKPLYMSGLNIFIAHRKYAICFEMLLANGFTNLRTIDSYAIRLESFILF